MAHRILPYPSQPDTFVGLVDTYTSVAHRMPTLCITPRQFLQDIILFNSFHAYLSIGVLVTFDLNTCECLLLRLQSQTFHLFLHQIVAYPSNHISRTQNIHIKCASKIVAHPSNQIPHTKHIY